ncbi:CFI-box-CTERM domain-containing protein [Bdellovibrio sp. HCB337]|uniref:CFI-box-CTERM domain-containing protein n=1 Tax=Bdellovibrio sp. HCB337 TaxID=3394358 RepID=UPI0039A67BFE
MEVSRTIISNILLSAVLFIGSYAHAQTATPTPTTTAMRIDNNGVGGASGYRVGTEASGTVAATLPTIYGGLTDSACTTTDGTSTCNSCTGTAGLAVCNHNSIYPTLLLQITIRSDTAATFGGTPKVIWRFSDGTGANLPENTPSLQVGQPFTVQIRWSTLCNAAGAGGNCTTALTSTRTLNIGIDNNNDNDFEEKVDVNVVISYADATMAALTATCPVGATTLPAVTEGICDYTVARGDEKVYITDYAASGNDLQTPSAAVKFDRVVLFYKNNVADPSTVTNADPYIPLSLTNNAPNEPSISDNRITGLTNDIPYCFALGNMDQTGNISRFPPAAALVDPLNATKFCATPAEVVGLLDDKSCFIATATFGSAMAPEVQTFRQFRNEFMLTNSFGKSLVKAYYKFGPEAAEWISHSEFLRTLSVWMLWPILMFVKLSLAFGLLPAALMSLAIALLLKRSFSHLWQTRVAKGDA